MRLYLTSAMLRLEPGQRWEVMDALVQKSVDKDDHNLPLMVWYALEPLSVLDAKRVLQLGEKAKLPKILPYTIQRVGAIGSNDSKKALKDLNDRLGKGHSHEHHENQMLIGKYLGE